MVKVCEKEFPKGSFPNQKSDGYYMDGYLNENSNILCKRIVDDMQFVILVSGHGTVRNGKSTFAQQYGFYLTSKVNETHKLNNTFDLNNIVFRGEDLIETAFKLKPYSVLVLDEGDDLTDAYWSKLSRNLRRFFRKCGQLNLFIVLLIPDFFELPRTYAVTRSNCLIDVFFYKDFRRGYFDFYNLPSKRKLYVKGKKWGDYTAQKSLFQGRFSNVYTIDKEAYNKKKYLDLLEEDAPKFTKEQITKRVAFTVLNNLPKLEAKWKQKLTNKDKSQLLSVSEMTITRYAKEIKENNTPQPTTYNNLT